MINGATAAMLLATGTAPAAPDQMQFAVIETPEEKFVQITLSGGQTRIFATGPIDATAASRFRSIVRQKGIKWAKVHFNSPGGSLLGGLLLGEVIREFEFDTEVGAVGWSYGHPPAAVCASACAYAFAGGLNRFISDSAGRLGIHQFHDGGDNQGDLSEAQAVSGALVSYLQKMGVDASAFALATTAESSSMVWLSEKDALRLRLANNGSQLTTAEIKLTAGNPYLRLEQVHHDVTSRVLLFCENGKFSISAGIVTTPELSQMRSGAVRSYLELDGRDTLSSSREANATAQGSTLWISRDLPAGVLLDLQRTDTLGMWVENGGPMRWGALMDMRPVQPRIEYFVENCMTL